MAIIWYEKNPGATEDEIRAFEEKEQFVLPESYKAFLREMDGGQAAWGHDVPYIDERFGRTSASIYTFIGIRETAFAHQTSYLHRSPDIEARMEAMKADAKAKYGHSDRSPYNLSIVRRNLKRDDTEYEKYFPDDMLFIVTTETGHTGITLLNGAEEVYLWFDYQDAVLLAPTFTEFLELIRFDVSDEDDDQWKKGF